LHAHVEPGAGRFNSLKDEQFVETRLRQSDDAFIRQDVPGKRGHGKVLRQDGRHQEKKIHHTSHTHGVSAHLGLVLERRGLEQQARG
jgi:hypothetical protein